MGTEQAALLVEGRRELGQCQRIWEGGGVSEEREWVERREKESEYERMGRKWIERMGFSGYGWKLRNGL